jgi:hypothetical protein
MFFKEFLRVRSTLLWFTVVLVAIAAGIQVVAMLAPGAMTSNDSGAKATTTTTVRAKTSQHVGPAGFKGGVNVAVTDEQGKAHSATATSKGPQETPWVELFGAAGFIAAIVSTVLGSTLAQENDHLEVAWTRPRSRTGYATTLMAVDALGIIIAQLIVFAFIIAHMASYHPDQHLVAGPNDALNAIRFMLFPLAWYGLIVALSASMRGRAGVVQGLIWPIALGLTALPEAPLPGIWHRILVAISLINPISYISYSEHDNGIATGAALSSATLAVAALAAIVVASWAAATYQWRRLQA